MLVKALAKNSEFTYGVHKDVLAEVAPDNAFTMLDQGVLISALKHLDQGVMGSVRALNHKLQLLRQAIAYGLTYKVETTDECRLRLLFAVYKRNKTNGEGRLSSKLSLGAGGHIEGDDVSYHTIHDNDELIPTSAIDMLETIDDSYIREYIEEVLLATRDGLDLTAGIVGAANTVGFQKVGFVMDSSPEPDYVGNIHFGVVYALDASNEVASFEMREPQNDAVAWASVDDLLNDPMFSNPETPFEPWSQMIVGQIKALEAYILSTFHNVDGTTREVPEEPVIATTTVDIHIRTQLEEIAKAAWDSVTADTSISIAEAAKATEKLTVDLINEKLGAFITDKFRVEVTPLAGQDQEGHYFTVDLSVTKHDGETIEVNTKQHLVTTEASEA
jgi:predicted NUDIX family phosphoesterase